MLVERRLVFCCTGLSAISIGMVICFSTSSALLPGHWVIISISVFVTSGNASIGISLNVIIPVIIKTPKANKIKYLFVNENATMYFKTLVIS